MRFVRFPRNTKREHTTRRLASAKRAIERQRQSWGLFADVMTPQDASLEERLARIDDECDRFWSQLRRFVAGEWRKGRTVLRSLPAERRAELLAEWQRCNWPGDATYFLDFLRTKHPELFETVRECAG